MKLAFISDIHGNSEALKAVLKNIESRDVDKIVVLGDLCFRGPRPKESLDLIRGLETVVIKGNADEWVVRGIRKGEVKNEAYEIMTIEREWTVAQLAIGLSYRGRGFEPSSVSCNPE
jgi:predicted phosphodiesterase